MDLRSIVVADKSHLKAGEWKRGEIPRSLWPSRRAKSKAYKYGAGYQWRVVTFWALGTECRVRIVLNLEKQVLRSTLGVVQGGETTILCDYEYHASEPGWHCHARCDDVEQLDSTFSRFGAKRMPAANKYHRRRAFKFGKADISEVTAFNETVRFYKLDREEGTL